MKEFLKFLGSCALILLIPLAVFAYTATTPDTATNTAKHVYSLVGDVKCQIPITDTEEGAFAAAHCLQSRIQQGQTEFIGENDRGERKTFKLVKWEYKERGKDYVRLSDGDGRGLPIYRGPIYKGMPVRMVSPKLGETHGRIMVVPDKRYDPLRLYMDIGQCGESGSLVLTSEGEVLGIFVARTGAPGNNAPGVVLRIKEIL